VAFGLSTLKNLPIERGAAENKKLNGNSFYQFNKI
jgi:hypothetical protein